MSRRPSRQQRPRQFDVDEWEPVTKVGRQVKAGEITSLEDLFQLALPIKEPEIIDVLLPDLQEEVIDINLVQKQTDAGEKSRFKATVIVGNENGFVHSIEKSNGLAITVKLKLLGANAQL